MRRSSGTLEVLEPFCCGQDPITIIPFKLGCNAVASKESRHTFNGMLCANFIRDDGYENILYCNNSLKMVI
ncbi:hypothetical protein ACQKL5_20835 [Peribacillus sp. NPDC097675]|uniref:hypothetical protein n=1 Tax=Peribacillus sp. NPDC097675 TaxID=3390618 RepID=UPI003CFE8397